MCVCVCVDVVLVVVVVQKTARQRRKKGPKTSEQGEETPSSRSRISELKGRPACKLGNSSCQSRDLIGGNGATTAGGGEGKLILGEMEKMVGVRHTFPLLLFPLLVCLSL